MILLFTDFGLEGPYLGELTAVLKRAAPEVPVVNLMADAAPFRPDLAGYLLAALLERAARPGDVVVAVVDPGVGGARAPLALEADGVRLVGPDNGLFEPLLRRARRSTVRRIVWRPADLSATFHGRDLFAPVAARLARGREDGLDPAAATRFPDRPDDLPAVVHVDRYGNAVTGLRAAALPLGTVLVARGRPLARLRTFGDAPPGQPFWYENSIGLAELAQNGGSAAAALGVAPGDPVDVEPA